MPILLKCFPKTKERGNLPNTFYTANSRDSKIRQGRHPNEQMWDHVPKNIDAKIPHKSNQTRKASCSAIQWELFRGCEAGSALGKHCDSTRHPCALTKELSDAAKPNINAQKSAVSPHTSNRLPQRDQDNNPVRGCVKENKTLWNKCG